MKRFFKTIAILFFLTSPAMAQFVQPLETKAGGPVAIGQAMAQVDPGTQKVAIVQAASATPPSGGIIQLSAFGWLEPYVDSALQALIAAGFAWFAKSKYSSMLDESSRAALETFVKNRASSLLADGAVQIKGKAVHVDNGLLYRAANESATAIPDALKRFKLSPEVVAQKIIDAIPQTPAGAQIVAAAHADPAAADAPVPDRPAAAPGGFVPPVSAA